MAPKEEFEFIPLMQGEAELCGTEIPATICSVIIFFKITLYNNTDVRLLRR